MLSNNRLLSNMQITAVFNAIRMEGSQLEQEFLGGVIVVNMIRNRYSYERKLKCIILSRNFRHWRQNVSGVQRFQVDFSKIADYVRSKTNELF